MTNVQTYLTHFLDVALEAAPWLALGLIAAGLLKGLLPAGALARFVGKPGLGSVIRGSLIGVPLPLCSCGVVPAALGLRREGASKGATVSFLVSTPQTGVDSLAVSYALLGPMLTLARPIASVITAIAGGLAAEAVDRKTPANPSEPESPRPCCCSTEESTCGGTRSVSLGVINQPPPPPPQPTLTQKVWRGQTYAWTTILDDMAVWLLLGLAVAALINTLAPPDTLHAIGSGLPAMIAMVLIGIPMYICATASTPIAASLLVAGISPGTVLVFLLAGPATNAGTVAVIRRELGTASTAAYLAAIIVVSIAAGLVTDIALTSAGWTAPETAHEHHSVATMIISWLALLMLIVIGSRKLIPSRAITPPDKDVSHAAPGD
ncbi:SO_0444 family Cu/Zn efflux transporter [Mucisphaera calidilacus]|uniref:Putative permease n=1 Tax=Mucisphaera calidilacus TaxID=2527982 RepID=A0A518C0V6_9BACT|nr:SO_0444 family Cu/Zn efflux transporter [Mucisphaera calidilacus]QDU72861.1 putative permease [Mucisphaera calidilacus]